MTKRVAGRKAENPAVVQFIEAAGTTFNAFARNYGLSRRTLFSQLTRGYCAWPRRKVEGQSTHEMYVRWMMMRQRCENPSASGYHNYGGRGVKVCQRWRSFQLFLADVGYPPTPKHTLDRIDNNGHYEPSNVRWATKAEQQLNRRPRKRGAA